jgi:hypothetical protein
MRPIRLATLALVAVAALALTACYSIRSQTVSQLDGIGDVQIETTLCEDTSGFGGPPNGCPVSNQPGGGSPTNVLIAYRVPDGTGAPDTLDATTAGPPITFTQDQSYTDSLNSVAAAPSGEHWVGYKGDQSLGPDITVTGRFTLPKPAGGKPFQGPFKYRTVVGFQHLNSQTPPQDPVVCNSDPTQPSPPNSNGTSAVCIDYPGNGTWQADEEFATRDLGITVGDPTSVQQNSSGQVPFTAQFAGSADSSVKFDLSIASDVPDGVKLTPSATTLEPSSDSSTPITVKADVAPTVPTGTYNITLTARNSAGQERKATAKLVVALGKPLNLALPFVSGTDAVGQTVNCSNGDWSSSPTKFAFQWTRDGADIAGATSNSYKLTEEDGALLVACRVTASNDVGVGSATSGPIRVAQEGGADVKLNGPVKVTKNSNGTYSVDTGITVSCPPRLPQSCGGGNHVTANVATTSVRRSAVKEVAHSGFAVTSGSKLKVVLRLSPSASKTLAAKGSLKLAAKVVTRNHLLQQVTSQKQLTAKRPR